MHTAARIVSLLMLAASLQAAAAAEQPISSSEVRDLESLRATLRLLIDNGNILSDETMSGVAASYSGLVREYLDHLNSVLSSAKSPAEVYLIHQQSDLDVAGELLLKVQQMGGQVSVGLGAALHKLVEGPSSRLLQQYLTSAAGLAKLPEMRARAAEISSSIGSLLQAATEDLAEQLKAHAAALPSGHVKSFIADLSSTVASLQKEEVESELPEQQQQQQFSSGELLDFKRVLDSAIDKQTLKYVLTHFGSKTAARSIIQELLARDLDSQNLIDLLNAMNASLQ